MPETYVITIHVKESEVARFRALLEPVLDAMGHEATFIYAALHAHSDRPNILQPHET